MAAENYGSFPGEVMKAGRLVTKLAGLPALLVVLSVLVAFPNARAETPPDLAWIRQFGTPAVDDGSGVAADATGIYIFGWTEGALPGEVNAGREDFFVRKYHPDGTEAWTRQFGGSELDIAEAIALHSTGIYLAGRVGRVGAEEDAFVRRITLDGEAVWTQTFGTTPYFDIADGVAVDESGAYITGQTCGALPGQTQTGFCDAFVRRYTLEGTEVWTRQFGASIGSAGMAIVSDGASAYVGGIAQGPLPGQTAHGLSDAFLRKYSLTGAEEWTRQFGSSGYQRVVENGMALDPRDPDEPRIYVGTYGDEEAQGSRLRSFNGDGTETWARPLVATPQAVAADPDGVFTGGILPSDLDPSGDAWVAKYDPDGNEFWTLSFGTSTPDGIGGIAPLPDGVYLAGSTDGPFPGQTHFGETDAFLVKLGEPVDHPCPRSQGYWKNHPSAWPVSSLTLGAVSMTRGELLDLLRAPSRGDTSLILARQLVAARLNMAAGSDPDPAANAIAAADSLLSKYPGKLPYDVLPSSRDGKDMLATAERLDAYNSGDQTPDCREEAQGVVGGGAARKDWVPIFPSNWDSEAAKVGTKLKEARESGRDATSTIAIALSA